MINNSTIENVRRNKYNTEMFQLITSFTLGVVFGAISLGLMWYFLFIIVYELGYAILTWGVYPFWSFRTRVTVNLLGVIGWVIGRWVYLRLDPLMEPFSKQVDIMSMEIS